MRRGAGGERSTGIGARRGEGALQHTITYANGWVLSVDGAARRIPAWAALLLAVATLAAGTFGGVAVYRLLPAPAAAFLPQLLDRAAQYLLVLGPLYLVAFGVGRAYERRAARAPNIAPAAAAPLGAVLGGLFFLIALALAAVLGAVRLGGTVEAFDHRLSGAAALGVLILFQAGAEEVFFRGWLQPILAARWGPWIGLGTTAALFAAAHAAVALGSRPLGAVAWLNDALAGFAFGLLALRTGGLAAPIAAHWAWNWTEAAVVGATPNPGVDPLGALFDLDLAGAPLIAGGADEMNGSLCATLALAGLIACAALWRPREQGMAPDPASGV